MICIFMNRFYTNYLAAVYAEDKTEEERYDALHFLESQVHQETEIIRHRRCRSTDG